MDDVEEESVEDSRKREINIETEFNMIKSVLTRSS